MADEDKKQIKYIFGTAVFLAIAAVLLTLTTYVMRPTDKRFFQGESSWILCRRQRQPGCGRLWEQCTLPLSEQSAALETAGHHIIRDRHGSAAGLCDTVTDR